MRALARRELVPTAPMLAMLAALAACGSPATAPTVPPVALPPTEPPPTPPPTPTPTVVAVHRAELPGACTPNGLCWEHPRPIGAMWHDVAIAGDAAIAVGSGGALARLSTSADGRVSVALAEPLDRDLELARGAGDAVIVASDQGFLAWVDPASSPFAVSDAGRLPRVFPEQPTSAVLDLWAESRERVLVGGLYGAVAETSGGAWVDRSRESSDASTLGAGAGGALAVAAGRTFRWLSDPSAAEERIPISERVTRLLVVDRTHAFALGMQGALAERDADGWHELLPRTPRTITPGQSFRSLVVLDPTATPTIVVIDGHGTAYSRVGWHAQGGAFREEPIAWPAPRAGSHGPPTTWWLEALDDGRVIAGGDAFATRQRDGTWQASTEREPGTYAACAARGARRGPWAGTARWRTSTARRGPR